MEYIQNLEICNSTLIVSGLLLISLIYNCFCYRTKEVDPHLELEMTEQNIIPVEHVETQTSPIEDEDKMYTDSMRNYMKRYSKDVIDVKVDLEPKRRKY